MATPLPATAPRGVLATLPWRTAQRDLKAVLKLLIDAKIDPRAPLGGLLLERLFARVGECRDLFVLRGVRAKRHSVLQLAGRSLAADAGEIARIDSLTGGHGRALLRLLSNLIELRAGHAGRPQPQAQAPTPRRVAAPRAPAATPRAAPAAANEDVRSPGAMPLAA